MRDTLSAVADQSTDSCGTLVLDTVALLEGTMTPEEYRSKWVSPQKPRCMGLCSDARSRQVQEGSLWSS